MCNFDSHTLKMRIIFCFVFTLSFGLGALVGFHIPPLLEPRFPALEENLIVNRSILTIPPNNNENDGDGFTEGIFWSDTVERRLPKGFGPEELNTWTSTTRVAVKLEEGCGRMKNRLVMFADGSRACARYRDNSDQLQGELLSFCLAQLLGLHNVVPTKLAIFDVHSPAWRMVRTQARLAQWQDGRPLVLTRYVPELEPSEIPESLREEPRQLGPKERRPDPITLAQWSDLLIFDYLTGNMDRLVNNLFNEKWNARSMDAPTHNLARESSSGLLLFLDNESGLLHSYRLLHKYGTYHRALLDGLCVFRKETARRVAQLLHSGDGGLAARLNIWYRRLIPEGKDSPLPGLPRSNVKTLERRLEDVLEQVERCRQKYGGPPLDSADLSITKLQS